MIAYGALISAKYGLTVPDESWLLPRDSNCKSVATQGDNSLWFAGETPPAVRSEVAEATVAASLASTCAAAGSVARYGPPVSIWTSRFYLEEIQ